MNYNLMIKSKYNLQPIKKGKNHFADHKGCCNDASITIRHTILAPRLRINVVHLKSLKNLSTKKLSCSPHALLVEKLKYFQNLKSGKACMKVAEHVLL